jgi:hypothetical protein
VGLGVTLTIPSREEEGKMSTGYTAELMEKGMGFKPFVMRCARNFGALAMMRDDPMDSPIPERFEPSDYHVKVLAESKEKHGHLSGMTENEKIAFGESEKETAIKNRKEYIKRKSEQNARLVEMHSQVLAWRIPTPDHAELKRFMLDQIDISMNDIGYDHKELTELEASSPMKFYVKAVSEAQWAINYHTEEMAKEIERADKRTEWVNQLRKSLG